MENYIKLFLLFFFLIQSTNFAGITEIEEKVLADNIKRFYKVSDGIYRSSQPNRKQMELLDVMGLKTVLNLRKHHSDDYEAKYTDLSLDSVKMNAGKIKDEEIISALKVIKNSKKPLLIHCWHGSDRTGVVVAMYRIIFEDYTKTEAVKELRKKEYGYHEAFYGNIVEYIENADIEYLKDKIL